MAGVPFDPAWLRPVQQLTNGDLGQYAKWLLCNLGRMTDRRRAKLALLAARNELAHRRWVARTERRARRARLAADRTAGYG